MAVEQREIPQEFIDSTQLEVVAKDGKQVEPTNVVEFGDTTKAAAENIHDDGDAGVNSEAIKWAHAQIKERNVAAQPVRTMTPFAVESEEVGASNSSNEFNTANVEPAKVERAEEVGVEVDQAKETLTPEQINLESANVFDIKSPEAVHAAINRSLELVEMAKNTPFAEKVQSRTLHSIMALEGFAVQPNAAATTIERLIALSNSYPDGAELQNLAKQVDRLASTLYQHREQAPFTKELANNVLSFVAEYSKKSGIDNHELAALAGDAILENNLQQVRAMLASSSKVDEVSFATAAASWPSKANESDSSASVMERVVDEGNPDIYAKTWPQVAAVESAVVAPDEHQEQIESEMVLGPAGQAAVEVESATEDEEVKTPSEVAVEPVAELKEEPVQDSSTAEASPAEVVDGAKLPTAYEVALEKTKVEAVGAQPEAVEGLKPALASSREQIEETQRTWNAAPATVRNQIKFLEGLNEVNGSVNDYAQSMLGQMREGVFVSRINGEILNALAGESLEQQIARQEQLVAELKFIQKQIEDATFSSKEFQKDYKKLDQMQVEKSPRVGELESELTARQQKINERMRNEFAEKQWVKSFVVKRLQNNPKIKNKAVLAKMPELRAGGA